MRTTRFFLAFAVCGLAVALAAAPATKPAHKSAAAAKPAARARMDINSATQIQLEKLPGVDRPMAKRIIAGRPYESVRDLTRVGVPKATIEKIAPLVVADMSMPDSHWRTMERPAAHKK